MDIRTSAVDQATIVSETNPARPSSVVRFEVLMYAAILFDVVSFFVQYGSYLDVGFLFGFLPMMLLFPALGALALTFLAARRRMNWARIALLALLFLNMFGIFSIFGAFLNNTVSVLLTAVPKVLNIAAIVYIFTPSANKWFEPKLFAGGASPVAAVASPSTVWLKGIPRVNLISMLISLGLVFGLDLSILRESSELLAFWIFMLVVLGFFAVFYYLENFVLKKKFGATSARQDKWIASLAGFRNVIFILNFIPFIQILGAILLFGGGIPFLVAYGVLVGRRSRETPQPLPATAAPPLHS